MIFAVNYTHQWGGLAEHVNADVIGQSHSETLGTSREQAECAVRDHRSGAIQWLKVNLTVYHRSRV